MPGTLKINEQLAAKNMNNDFSDITKKLGPPKWYDRHGYPRYNVYHPKHTYNIYADVSALILVACQSCGKKMRVAVTYSKMDLIQRFMNNERHKKEQLTSSEKSFIKTTFKTATKETKIDLNKVARIFSYPLKTKPKAFAYGDPPSHNSSVEFCHIGGTQTSIPIRILQFWERDESHNWNRNKKYEFEFKNAED